MRSHSMSSITSFLRSALLFVTFVTTSAWAQTPFSAIHYRSTAGDYIGQGQTLTGTTPQWTFSADAPGSGFGPGFIRATMVGPGGVQYSLDIAAHAMQPLALGAYEEAARASFREASPGLDFGGAGRGCNQVMGRFVVRDLDLGPGTAVNRLAVDFDQWCENGAATLHGEFRFNTTVPLSTLPTGTDTTPDPFAFPTKNPVMPGAIIESNPIALLGMNANAVMSITGGEYRRNKGVWDSQPRFVQPMDRIEVRVVAPRTQGASGTVTLNVGGQTATFTATSYLDTGAPVSLLSFRSTTGDYIGQGNTRHFFVPPNIVTASRNFDNGVSFNFSLTGSLYFTLDLSAPGDVTLVPGAYEAARRFPFQGPTEPGLDFSGDGRGCNQLTGRFIVHEAVYNPDDSVAAFAADFEQRCENTGPPLFGEVRFNSSIPFSTATESDCTTSGCTDLALAQSVNANPASAGKDAIVTMTVTNRGPATASGVTVAATFDPSATVIWASPGCVRQGTDPTYLCTAGDLLSNTSARLRLVLRKAGTGTISNNATVSSATPDSDASNNSSLLIVPVNATPAGVPVPRYRLYSPVTLEHHFTTDLNEYNVLGASGGWVQEGTAGNVLNNPGTFNAVTAVPYYRLYNSFNNWHHWTTDPNEYYTLTEYPGYWNAEGVDAYILPVNTAGATELYRLVYPNGTALHHWTIDANEYNTLIATYGWVGEGGSGFVIQ
jgi:uncharacterized protein DUF11/uncharacterized protein DUF5648